MMQTIPIKSLPEDASQQSKVAHDRLRPLDPHAELLTPGPANVGAGASVNLPTLTKADLCDALFTQLGLNKREAREFVEAFFEMLHDGLLESGQCKLAGFGNFFIRRKAPRPGRNPRTGQSVSIAARQVVGFRASPTLKSMVQGDRSPPADSG